MGLVLCPFHHFYLGWIYRQVVKGRLLEYISVRLLSMQSSEHSIHLLIHLDIYLWQSKPLIQLWLPVRYLHWHYIFCSVYLSCWNGAYWLSLEDALG